jgi:hypothetical protein
MEPYAGDLVVILLFMPGEFKSSVQILRQTIQSLGLFLYARYPHPCRLPVLYHIFCTIKKWYNFYGTFFVPNNLYQNKMVQFSWYKNIGPVKNESLFQDLMGTGGNG